MKTLLIILFLLSFITTGFGQVSHSSIHKKDLKQIIKVLTADSLEGRGTGTKGQKAAQRFISNKFKEIGLNTYNEYSYLEKFEVEQRYWGEVYIQARNTKLINFEKIVLQGSNIYNDEVEKEVVFAGRGTDEELDQIDVADRFVLIFVDNLRTGIRFKSKLAERNAFGVILANPDLEIQFESIRRSLKDYYLGKRYSLTNESKSFHKPVVWDTIEYVNSILIPNDQVENIIGLSIRKLEQLIEEEKIGEAPMPTIKAKFERIEEKIETANVIGTLKGKTDKTIVISAHYDHLGKIDDQFFPGADDNASGTAGLIELAEYFSTMKNLKYNLMFLATSAEEAGLLGSKYHVNKESFKPEEIVCNINLDMISRSDDQHIGNSYLYCIGSDQSDPLDALIKEADDSYRKCDFDYSLNNSTDPLGIYTRSDQYSFYEKEIPAIFFHSGTHSDYHKTTDTANKISYRNLEHRVTLISKVIELIQSEGLEN
jgi:hypothetical protein